MRWLVEKFEGGIVLEKSKPSGGFEAFTGHTVGGLKHCIRIPKQCANSASTTRTQRSRS
jgi:hypothetical protein